MKKIIILAFLCFSCNPIHTTPDGRKYKLNEICLSGHDEPIYVLQKIGDVWINQYAGESFVCDSKIYDTIWIKDTVIKNK